MTAVVAPFSPTEDDIAEFRRLHQRLGDAVESSIHGKRGVIDLVLVATFAGGHVLLEDIPGTGKTTLARSVARALGGQVRRVQFTPDLLPSDVTGTTVFDPRDGQIRFRPGPVFANVVLADEINRASAKTQSALLEVMEERTVTVDGAAHPVPDPFVVIATQNPIDLDGTYRLPEAQLDRFLVRTSLGYPDAEHEIDVLRPGSTAGRVADVPVVTTPDEVAALAERLSGLHVADLLLRYVRDIGLAVRTDPRVRIGASTRGLRSLVRCLQVYAAAQGRNYVVPSDVQRLAESVLAHRTVLTRDAVLAGHTAGSIVQEALETVPPPQPDQD
ncbi:MULTISPECIES: AAA family ATPase [unclassified Nocardioides]|uniref:AAA family ATPase n=1 Tax=unclassified Nocardioides TaxID=2615069 RepID=UPI0009F03E56|nr:MULTISPECIES: MoxR family ATPase [unclassified Nocardioides]GAW47809.1 ATPase [Nocardioides sp. PD653-B2]GAW53557.1 ATPase [Nocardioides sp. PD653]